MTAMPTDAFGAEPRPGCDSVQDARAHLLSADLSGTRFASGSGAPASATESAEPSRAEHGSVEEQDGSTRWSGQLSASTAKADDGPEHRHTQSPAQHELIEWVTDSDDRYSWVRAYCACGETFDAAQDDGARGLILRRHRDHVHECRDAEHRAFTRRWMAERGL